MEESEIDKILKPQNKLVAFFIIYLAIALACIGVVFYAKFANDKEELLNLSEIVSNEYEEEGQYVKLDINSLPILLAANQEGDNYLYYIADTEGKTYIARLSNETFQKIIEMRNEETGMLNSTYQLKGTTKNIDEQTKRLAIQNSIKVFGNKEINNDNFSEYLGKVYIEEKNVSSRAVTLYTISALAGLFFLIISFGYLLPGILKSKKILSNKELVEDLRTELGNLTDIPYKEQHVYLTRKYLVSGIQVIKYEDIVKGYILKQRTYGIKVGENLMIQTKNGSKHIIASVTTNSNILNNILKDIHSKNTNIEAEYSEENKKVYKNE